MEKKELDDKTVHEPSTGVLLLDDRHRSFWLSGSCRDFCTLKPRAQECILQSVGAQFQ